MPNPAPHVLIMDDSPPILDLLQEFLEEEGYCVTTSTTLLDVAHIAALAPDCILLEWRFGNHPDTGWRHVLRLRLEPALIWTPLVLCTTADRPRSDPQIAQVLKHLQVAVVPKPCALAHLLRIMQLAMRPPSLRVLDDVVRRPQGYEGVNRLDGRLHLPQPVQVLSLGQGV